MAEAPTLEELVYRWHQVMFRLDEIDEMLATGLTEDEAGALDAERANHDRELAAIEGQLGDASVTRLRRGHELDQAYARQMRQMDEEK
jgi:hypothetical protein